jgi:hypothetical protein
MKTLAVRFKLTKMGAAPTLVSVAALQQTSKDKAHKRWSGGRRYDGLDTFGVLHVNQKKTKLESPLNDDFVEWADR